MIQTRLETALFPVSSTPSVFGGKITHKRSEVRSSEQQSGLPSSERTHRHSSKNTSKTIAINNSDLFNKEHNNISVYIVHGVYAIDLYLGIACYSQRPHLGVAKVHRLTTTVISVEPVKET